LIAELFFAFGGRAGNRVVNDLDVRLVLRRRLERVEHARPLEFVDGGTECVVLRLRAADELEHRFFETAAQPAKRGSVGEFIRALVLKAPRVLLRGDGAAIEMHSMNVVALCGFCLDRDRDGRPRIERGRRAVHRADFVNVAVIGLRGVVRPLKSLYRMQPRADGNAGAGRRIDRLKSLQSLKPILFVFGVVAPLDRKPEATRARGGRQIEGEKHDVRAADRPDAETLAGDRGLPHCCHSLWGVVILFFRKHGVNRKVVAVSPQTHACPTARLGSGPRMVHGTSAVHASRSRDSPAIERTSAGRSAFRYGI
jgi:hypothetical protein